MLHPAQAIRARGYVVSEKPMATRYEDGVKMVEACDRAGAWLL